MILVSRGPDNGDFIIHKGVLEICQYYNLKENKVIHMNYVDKYTFLFKVFSAEGYDPANFYHSMSKCLSAIDAKSSSLVTDS